MRDRYETDNDLARERRVFHLIADAQFRANGIIMRPTKLTDSGRVDFTINCTPAKPTTVHGIMEVKTNTFTDSTSDVFKVARRKWVDFRSHILRLPRSADEIPRFGIMACAWRDGVVTFAEFEDTPLHAEFSIDYCPEIERGGRMHKTRDSWDIEPMAIFPHCRWTRLHPDEELRVMVLMCKIQQAARARSQQAC